MARARTKITITGNILITFFTEPRPIQIVLLELYTHIRYYAIDGFDLKCLKSGGENPNKAEKSIGKDCRIRYNLLENELEGNRNDRIEGAILNHLDKLENKSIHIIREAYRQFPNLCMLWSVGKDSTVMLWLVRKAFFGHVPMPLVHIDTHYKIPEMIEYRDALAGQWKLDMIYGENTDALSSKDTFPDGNTSRIQCCKNLKTEALKREAVTGFTNESLTVSNGALSPVSSEDGGITWTAAFTPMADIEEATNVISLDLTGVVDAAGNTGIGTVGSANYTIDTKHPSVVSVGVPADGVYKYGDELEFLVTFDEAVTVNTTVGTPQIALIIGGSTVYLNYVSGSGTTELKFAYTVANDQTDSDGITVGSLDLNGSSISDAAGNAAILALNGIGSTANILVDTSKTLIIPYLVDSTIDNAVVEVNGVKQDAGTSVTTAKDGQNVTTVIVDDAKLDKILENSGEKPTITLPSSSSNVTVGELNGQTIKNMERKEATLEIRTDTVTYSLPASQININAVLEQIGDQVALKDIKVSVKIAEPSADTVKIVEDTANKNSYQIVVNPVQFEITCTSGDKTVEVSRFNGYVERTVAIPDGVDPNKITTGVVLNEDGTLRHVPTDIVVINGKYYARINSLTNSIYSVIWNPIEFNDVVNYWAQTAINDMGSRMVVNGVGNGNYEPERSITRAEFAAIVVRAMGLAQGKTESSFADVSISDWYNGYVDTANSFGLITGYDSLSYGPNDLITREQAMVILARAMKLTGLNNSITDDETDAVLSGYSDRASVSEYAKKSVAACIKEGIVNGKTARAISPKNHVTRAEVAVMVQRLLQKSGLI